jgi:hypothetical protein
MAVLLSGVVVAAFACAEGVRTQEEAAPAHGNPYTSNPGAIPPEKLKRNEQIRDEFCRQQPNGCVSGFKFTPEGLKEMGDAKRDHGPYVPPEPGHLTDCHPDPNNPEKPICVHE